LQLFTQRVQHCDPNDQQYYGQWKMMPAEQLMSQSRYHSGIRRQSMRAGHSGKQR
jgi:hypothetical protein